MGKVRYSTKNKIVKKPSDGGVVKIRGGGVNEISQLQIDRIHPYRNQARKIFNDEELFGLVSSIKEVGIINPLLVVKSPELGFYHVVNGERRLRAAKEAGLETVPCIILHQEENSDIISVIDNIQRVDLHPVELASAYGNLIQKYGDKKVISEKIGVPYTSFLETLKLANLPAEIRNYILDNNIRSRSVFRKLLKEQTLDDMKHVLGIIEKNANIETRKKIIEVYKENGKAYIKVIDKSLDINKLEKLQAGFDELLNCC